MRKMFLTLLFMLSVCCYAKTQKAVSYDYSYLEEGIVKEINAMITQGWSVVSKTLEAQGFEVCYVNDDLAESQGLVAECYWIEAEDKNHIYLLSFVMNVHNKQCFGFFCMNGSKN